MKTACLSTFLATATMLSAATYHIDPTRGVDTHPGLTKEQAWKSFHPLVIVEENKM